MRILAISGSLREESFNTRLLEAAAKLAPVHVDVERWHGLRAVPPFDEDLESGEAPPAVRHLRHLIDTADAVLVSTPEYNGSVPGQLKNALDWASRPHRTNPLRNKPVAVVGASTGSFGALSAQADLRRILARIGARVIDVGIAVGDAPSKCSTDGDLADEDLRAEVSTVIGALVDAVSARQSVAA
jgi:chromate reductase